MPSRDPEAFHRPLHPKDTEAETYGCRNTQPDFCARLQVPKLCAFARSDGMCKAPPVSWKKQFHKLKLSK
jgi:hypothetical protein